MLFGESLSVISWEGPSGRAGQSSARACWRRSNAVGHWWPSHRPPDSAAVNRQEKGGVLSGGLQRRRWGLWVLRDNVNHDLEIDQLGRRIARLMKVYFTSDLHLGHANIIKYSSRPGLDEQQQRLLEQGEPFEVDPGAVNRMDALLIDNINSIVGPRDRLWVLGDFCVGQRQPAQAASQYLNRLVCKDVHLVWGNHDRRSIAGLFASTQDLVRIRVDGQKIVLCHYAMAVWEGSHRGTWQLYGHSHANAESWLDEHMPGRRSIDVGVDNANRLLGQYRPWSFEEIRSFLEDKTGCSIDHHQG